MDRLRKAMLVGVVAAAPLVALLVASPTPQSGATILSRRGRSLTEPDGPVEVRQ